MDIQLSDAEKVFIINGAEEGVRADGRGLFDYRPIIVETGVLSTTNGSARVRLASTDLLIGVKTELVVVEDFDSYRNRLNFSVDCSANATPLFVGRGGENLAVEVASVLDAAYDNKHVLPDFNRLILSPMHAWKLYVDIVILECGGNVVDAAAIGVKAALRNTEMCDVIVRPADEGKFSIDLASDNTVWKFDVTRAPLLSTVHKLGEANLADASLTEQACSRCALCVAASPIENSEKDESMWSEDQSMVTMIRQSGGGSLEVESLDEMVRMGVRTVLELNRALYKRLSEEDQDIDSDPSTTFML